MKPEPQGPEERPDAHGAGRTWQPVVRQGFYLWQWRGVIRFVLLNEAPSPDVHRWLSERASREGGGA